MPAVAIPDQVTQQLLSAVSPAAEEQLKALEKCLEHIDAQLPPASDDGQPAGDDEQQQQKTWWWKLRLQTLQHYERVFTASAICRGAYNAEVYAALRDADVADAAAGFARSGNLAAVAALLQRHPYSLAPRVLDALAAAPETLEPKLYEPVLRSIAALRAPPELSRRPDWVESEATCSLLRRQGEHRLLLATEPMAKLNFGWAPPTERQLVAWVSSRAIAIDRLSGQLAAAAQLLECCRAALHYGGEAVALAPLQRAAAQLMMVLKLGASRGSASSGRVWEFELGQFSAMDDAGRLQAFLQLVDSDSLPRDVDTAIVPFLNQLESLEPAETLRRVLAREAVCRLSWVVKFVQLEAERPAALGSAAEVARAACGAAYACPSADSWGLQEALLNAAAEAVGRDAAMEEEQQEALHRSLKLVHGHLTAARLLTKHGLPTPLAVVRDADAAEAGRLIGEVVGKACKGRPSESRWEDLWRDLEAARSGGLSMLPEGQVRSEVCRALLAAGSTRLVQTFLPGLDTAQQEALVLAAARKCFACEVAGGAEGAADAAARAKAVLAVLPASQAAAEEGQFIDAAQRLRALGVDLPPLALREAPNKAELLDRALRNAPAAALRDVDAVVQLAEALRVGSSRPQVVERVAAAALHSGDVALAERLSLQLAKERRRVGWEVAALVAADEGCSSEAARRLLLAFAMRHAPADQLAALLDSWQAADAVAEPGPCCWAPFSEGNGLDALLRPIHAALADYLSGGDDGSGERSSENDAPLVLSCLLALGQEGGQRWAGMLQQHAPSLGYDRARQAYLLGITACALTAVQPTFMDVEHLPAQVAAAQHRLHTPPCQLLAAVPPPTEAAKASGAHPALGSEASAGSGPSESGDGEVESMPMPGAASAANAAGWAALVRLCQLLVAAADAQRVSHMLPGIDAAGLSAGGDAAVHRDVVLQLAAAAASGSGAARQLNGRRAAMLHGDDAAETRAASPGSSDLQAGSAPTSPAAARQPIPRKKSEAVAEATADSDAALVGDIGTGKATLEHAVVLAQRYGVARWEVQLRYATTALHSGPARVAAVRRLVGKVWDELLQQGHARPALEALLSDVYPAESSAAPERLCYCLQLMQQCCAASAEGAAAWPVAAGALGGLGDAAGVLASCAPKLDAKAFLQPPMAIFTGWAGLPLPSVPSPAADAPALTAQLVQNAGVANVEQLASTINGIAAQHAVLAEACCRADDNTAVYPVTSSTAYTVLLCMELSSGRGEEGFQLKQLEAWAASMQRMRPENLVALLSFACLGGPSPLELPAGVRQPPVVLSPYQAQQLLQIGVQSLEAAAGRGGWAEELQQQAAALQSEHTRLSVMRRVETGCELTSAQLHAMQAAVAELQSSAATPASAAVGAACSGERGPLQQCLRELLVSGCPAADVVQVAEALLPLVAAPPPTDVAGEDAVALVEVETAADGATREALQTMTGAPFSGGLSAGDAVQNLYGIIRALDAAPNHSGRDVTGAVEALRGVVWALLQSHVSQHPSAGDAAAAEAQLQALHMLGSLGDSMWAGWAPPADVAAAAFNHREALLYSRTAAALAAAGWPGALQHAGAAAADFGDAELAEAALLRLLGRAESTAQLQAVASALSDVFSTAYPAAGDGAADALHRCWSACLAGLLSQGCLPPVLRALDAAAVRQLGGHPLPSLLTEEEAQAAVEAADTALGPAAAAAVALLVPHVRVQSGAWDRVVAAASSESTVADLAGLPGLAALAALALQQGRLAPLARSAPRLLRQLCLAMMQQQAAALWSEPIEGCAVGVTVRSALAASAAAALVSQRCYSAAAWVAMEHAGTHPLLRVLDSGPRVLQSLLRMGSKSGVEGRGSVELSAPATEAAMVPHAVQVVVQQLPQECDVALHQLIADTQP